MSSLDGPEKWLSEHGDALYNYAFMRVRDPHLAEDLVQETLLGALRAQERFEQRSSERTWLIGILKHKIVDHLRKSTRELAVDNVHEVADAVQEASFDQNGHWQVDVAGWSVPDRALERDQFWSILNECVSALPERMGAAFLLREVDGLSADEICKVLNVSSTNNVWVILSRVRLRLRECLSQKWFMLQS